MMKGRIPKLTVTLTALLVLLTAGCAATAEQVERRELQASVVAQALAERRYVIDIHSMHPQRGGVQQVSYGFALEVSGDTLKSYLPYFGRVYNVPYGGGKGLHFTQLLSGYEERRLKSGAKRIVMRARNEKDVYVFTLDVYDSGHANIGVRAQEREYISFEGEMQINENKK
jgi:hypothetical protein